MITWKSEKTMKEYQWPYNDIDQSDFVAQIAAVEKILQKYKAEYIGKSCETGLCNGSFTYEKIEQNIWKRKDDYIRVDSVFSKKPFLVLEFSKQENGPYEDADPFPYDLSEAELEQEIRYSLGIDRYPE